MENAFGIMASRFRVLLQPINLSPYKVEDIVLTTCVLHNYLRRHCRPSYTSSQVLDFEDIETGCIIREAEWRSQPQMIGLQVGNQRQAAQSAKEARNKYLSYFNNQGRVPWQDRAIGLQ